MPVSYLSSLLRVVQAAVREVATDDTSVRSAFDQAPQPVLFVSGVASNGTIAIELTFVDPEDNTPMEDVSSRAFGAFLDRFIEFVTSLPQPGLWGGTPHRMPRQAYSSQLTRRMDQVHRELRRSPKVALRVGGRYVEIEGDRMEIA